MELQQRRKMHSRVSTRHRGVSSAIVVAGFPTVEDGMPDQERIEKLVVNSSPVKFRVATLRRGENALPSGVPGARDWRVEIIDGELPDVHDNALVELRADGSSFSGAARAIEDGLEAERLTLVGNGPLVQGGPGPLLD